MNTAETDDIKRAVLQGGNILYPELLHYTVAINPKTNRPRFYPGGYCMSVKMVKTGASTKCLRCWWREINGETDTLERLRKTASAINKRRTVLGLYFTKYEVVDKLLNVDGLILPGVVMDWVEGETLNEYLLDTKNHNSSDLRQLAENFRIMCSCLLDQGVAHGDLSGPNVMVYNNMPILVDYDTMYFKEDGRREKSIDGTPPFQHPDRGSHRYMELCCDNFSHHVIYVTILILAEMPEAREDVDRREKLYFDKEDMLSANDFLLSDNRIRARKIGNDIINKELDAIYEALRGDYLAVPPIEMYKVTFCTACGRKYTDMEADFKYCPACGTLRVS